MTTKKPEVKFYAEPDIAEWLESIPESANKSSAIQDMLRTGIQATATLKWGEINLVDEVKALKRMLGSVLLEQKHYEIQLQDLTQMSAEHEDTLEDLTNWKQSFANFDLFEDLETDDIRTALEINQKLGARGVIEAVAIVPKLEARLDKLEDKIGKLTEVGKKPSR